MAQLSWPETFRPHFGKCATSWVTIEGRISEGEMGGGYGGPTVVQAHAFFVFCRLSLAGRMKGFTGVTKTRVRRQMNNEASAWLTSIEGLPDVHARLKGVVILDGRPALEVIQNNDETQTLQYLD